MFNELKIEKFYRVACVIIGVIMIISGFSVLSMDDSHTGYGGGVSRASTSIEFGADFYTTSAQYTGLAANAMTDVFDMLQTGFGLMFIFTGALVASKAVRELLYVLKAEEEEREEIESLNEEFNALEEDIKTEEEAPAE